MSSEMDIECPVWGCGEITTIDINEVIHTCNVCGGQFVYGELKTVQDAMRDHVK